jgi:hypothetical protein
MQKTFRNSTREGMKSRRRLAVPLCVFTNGTAFLFGVEFVSGVEALALTRDRERTRCTDVATGLPQRKSAPTVAADGSAPHHKDVF